MRWAVPIVRTLLGLVFFVFGLDYFLKFMPTPEPPSGPPGDYVGALAGSGYLTAIKVLEVTGGAILLSGKFAPLGITMLTPIIVNILLFEVCLAHQPGIGVALTAMAGFLIAGYRGHFKSVFAMDAKVSCCT